MPVQAPYRPRVSRETRLLFATVILAVIALWVLARFRFPEQPPSVNPVAPVLTQLAPTPAFGDLAAVVSDVQSRVLSAFLPLSLDAPATGSAGRRPVTVAALRIRDDVAAALFEAAEGAGTRPSPQAEDVRVLNVDSATGLATINVPAMRTVDLTRWAPARVESPRYLLSTATMPGAVALRPVFVSTLRSDECVTWGATVWSVPAGTDLAPGSFVFATTGAFAGLVIPHEGGTAILPAAALDEAVDRVLKQRQGNAGWIGVSVQPLTPALRAATGTTQGVIVTFVDPAGPAAGSIQAGDVLERMDDTPSPLTEELFGARTDRLLAGDAITFQVRRGELAQPVRLTAIQRPSPARTLGLTMRRARGGSEVIRVDPGSLGAARGLQPGDLITLAGDTLAPSPAQITRAFAMRAAPPLLLGVTRGSAHFVLAVDRR